MARIVTHTYRYKRPPRRKKAVPLEVPAVVKAANPAKARKLGLVSARKPGKQHAFVPDLAEEEVQPRRDTRQCDDAGLQGPDRREDPVMMTVACATLVATLGPVRPTRHDGAGGQGAAQGGVAWVVMPAMARTPVAGSHGCRP